MSLFARARRAPALICLAALCLVGLSGCDSGEDTGSDNNARLVVMHEAAVLGSIDLLANGERLATLAQGSASEPLSVAAGNTVLEVRNSGAEVTVLDLTLDLLAQPYLVVVLGETLNDLRFWAVDEPAPERAAGEAAVRVVNLDGGGFTYDIYLDDDQIAAGLEANKASDFVKVSLVEDGSEGLRTARLRVFNAGDDPSGRSLSVAPAEVTLGNRRAYMFVLRTDAENPDVISVTTITP